MNKPIVIMKDGFYSEDTDFAAVKAPQLLPIPSVTEIKSVVDNLLLIMMIWISMIKVLHELLDLS